MNLISPESFAVKSVHKMNLTTICTTAYLQKKTIKIQKDIKLQTFINSRIYTRKL